MSEISKADYVRLRDFESELCERLSVVHEQRTLIEVIEIDEAYFLVEQITVKFGHYCNESIELLNSINEGAIESETYYRFDTLDAAKKHVADFIINN